MNLYIAAPLAYASMADQLAEELSWRGHRIVSRWHRTVLDRQLRSDPASEDARLEALDADLRDLGLADGLVAITHVGHPRATLCELGWAIAHGCMIYWVQGPHGEGRNIFDEHGLVRRIVVKPGSDLAAAVAGVVRCT